MTVILAYNWPMIISMSLSINIASIIAYLTDLLSIPSVGLFVCLCLCDWKEYCGKTANWIQMPFGMVSGVG